MKARVVLLIAVLAMSTSSSKEQVTIWEAFWVV